MQPLHVDGRSRCWKPGGWGLGIYLHPPGRSLQGPLDPWTLPGLRDRQKWRALPPAQRSILDSRPRSQRPSGLAGHGGAPGRAHPKPLVSCNQRQRPWWRRQGSSQPPSWPGGPLAAWWWCFCAGPSHGEWDALERPGPPWDARSGAAGLHIVRMLVQPVRRPVGEDVRLLEAAPPAHVKSSYEDAPATPQVQPHDRARARASHLEPRPSSSPSETEITNVHPCLQALRLRGHLSHSTR